MVSADGGLQGENSTDGGLKQRIGALRESILGAFGLMMVAVTLASALNYLFTIIMTRMLDAKGAFSSFNSLNSIFLIVIMGALSVQTVITKYVAEFEVTGERQKVRLLLRRFSWWLLLLGGGVILLSVAVAWPLASALHLGSPVFVIILGTSVAITMYLTLPNGLLQGEQRWIALGGAQMSVAGLRIVFGVVMVAAGLGVYGALSAATIAGLLVAGVIIYFFRDMFRGPVVEDPTFKPSTALWALIPVAVAIFLVILMTQIDVVLVKALKGAVQADRYSYAAVAGKAVLFFPEGVSLVMFPRVSAMRERGEPTHHILWLSLAAATVLVGAVVGFYALFPSFTAKFFAGSNGKYIVGIKGPGGINFVVLFGLVMAIFALIKLLAFYHLALERKLFIVLYAAAAVLEVVGIFLFHRTLPQVLLVMLVVGGVLLLLNLLLAFKEKPGKGFSKEVEVPIT
ncbi:MAG: MATE family efflux transporter [Candidatus Geothermincolia bacterium]